MSRKYKNIFFKINCLLTFEYKKKTIKKKFNNKLI